jgi:hypothetical protein
MSGRLEADGMGGIPLKSALLSCRGHLPFTNLQSCCGVFGSTQMLISRL